MNLLKGNKYVFDTTVYIDALRGEPKYKQLTQKLIFQARFNRIPAGYSIVTELELWRGIKGLWTIEEHEALLRPMRRYPLLVRTAKRAGSIRSLLDQKAQKNQGPGMFDCVIAATAEYYELVLITRNAKDYQMILDHSIANIQIEDYK